ncbi:MAG TPA: tagaturonate reductase [Gemmatimonadaceae bacterium]|nr:tagaturonate reductase [Gemmatimonadaceae bacterium]
MTRPALDASRWPADAYDRRALPERVLQFGTGMLLRALPLAMIDAANRAGARAGRVVVVQSTPRGAAATLNAQDGLFTLVERGVEQGAPVERVRLVGSVSRALVATDEWDAVRDVAADPALRAIVSNVTEAGFRLDPDELTMDAPLAAPGDRAPRSFPAKLADLLYTRFRRAPEAPPLLVIPTELVDDNGPRLRAMVERLAARVADAGPFRDWLARSVGFHSSLVDRITTGAPAAAAREELESRLGYRDELLTVAEPYAFWAVEGEPAALHAALPIDVARPPAEGAERQVVFASDIERFRTRKIRLLNGAHTALAPLACLAGIRTVREAARHPQLGPCLHRVLYDEIVPALELGVAEATAFAASVEDRFGNPWLDHEWTVIATNQTVKMRLRVIPSLLAYAAKQGEVPNALALAVAAYLRYARDGGDGVGSWRGRSYTLNDPDLALLTRHWRAAGPGDPSEGIATETLERVAASASADAALWGESLARIPGLVAALTRWLVTLEREGVDGALETLLVATARSR